MIRTTKMLAATFAVATQLSVPLGLTTVSLVTTSCFNSKGPSNVSQGRQYISGDPTYDAFFGELYQTQVSLGQAPDREKLAREKLAAAVNLDKAAAPQAIGEALGKRMNDLFKANVAIKVTVAGLDDPTAEPKPSVASSSDPTDQSDKTLVAQLKETTTSEASIVGEMRKARATVSRLRSQVVALESNVDTAFKKRGKKKQNEVSKNIVDAKQMMDLMAIRVDEVERSGVAVLANVVQAAKYDAPPPPPPPPPEDDKKKKKKGGGSAAAGGAAPTGGAPPAAAPAPKPAAPSGGAAAPKPASPDFEP